MKLYYYVGPENIRARAAGTSPGTKIKSSADLYQWVMQNRLIVTFVVDEQGDLRVADRCSEHVACAEGQPVLSAGEMFLVPTEDGLRVQEISNQSTGYCPEPESWNVVATALDRIGIPHPGHFTQEIIFRRCPVCDERSIVKDSWFVCGVCGAGLPTRNFQ